MTQCLAQENICCAHIALALWNKKWDTLEEEKTKVVERSGGVMDAVMNGKSPQPSRTTR